VRSAIQPMVIVMMAARTYGGTESRLAVVEVYPRVLIMVGRKRLKA